ncbi:MAG: Cas10/Cmr2 second palm domain-containing protein [Coleofasciculus sp.]
MSIYIAITFSPVQSFIEKSRKLRDLFGASLILSHLSRRLIDILIPDDQNKDDLVISPGLPTVEKGLPNRILLKDIFPPEASDSEIDNQIKTALITAWGTILDICKAWIQTNVSELAPYHWDKEWRKWQKCTWEIFWGQGDSIPTAMQQLEQRKLRRNWTGINWIGESSSLTGTDAIAWQGLGAEDRNAQFINYSQEDRKIQAFYQELAWILDGKKTQDKRQTEGKYIAPNERLNIPELVKRLVTLPELAKSIQMETLDSGFQDIDRKPTQTTPGQWTGWFMGDGDKVGDKLIEIADQQGESGIKTFTKALREWGKEFEANFPKDKGRVIYAGGDDFLGILYSPDSAHPIPPLTALDWLISLPEQWQQHQQDITLSVGFVWVAGTVPQRDVLQHCREAETQAKRLGRNRVTIRVVFNSGQYVQWTCPWHYLEILKQYRDRDNKTHSNWQQSGQQSEQKPNWNHVYNDLLQLKSRHGFGLCVRDKQALSELGQEIMENRQAVLEFFDIYFPGQKERIEQNEKKEQDKTKKIIVMEDNTKLADQADAMIHWISDLITVGWYFLRNGE